MAALAEASPFVRLVEQGRQPVITPPDANTDGPNASLDANTLPPAPPTRRDYPTAQAWWDAVFSWERAHGKACDVYNDADLGRLIDRAEGTVANNRSRLGWQKYKDSEDVNLS